MAYPTFVNEANALAYCGVLWRNKMQEIAEKHGGKIIFGENPNDIRDYDSLSDEEKDSLLIFSYLGGTRLYDRFQTAQLAAPRERADSPGSWFINIDVDKSSKISPYLEGAVSDGSVAEVPDAWLGEEGVKP